MNRDHDHRADEELTRTLDRVHAHASSNRLDDLLARLQLLSLDREEW